MFKKYLVEVLEQYDSSINDREYLPGEIIVCEYESETGDGYENVEVVGTTDMLPYDILRIIEEVKGERI